MSQQTPSANAPEALDKYAAQPPVASRAEWMKLRLELLEREKANTRDYDRINALRRRLPMVKIEKEYVFDTAQGKKSLAELFGKHRQLIVQHFMFDPDWEKGCPSCTWYSKSLGYLDSLASLDIAFVIVSRAPLAKLEEYKRSKGISYEWVSSNGNDFNYDFHVTLDEARGSTEWNYREQETARGEMPGASVFLRNGDEVFHTYSCFARSMERLTDTNSLMDITPYGRQEDFEDSPAGWPQAPTYG